MDSTASDQSQKHLSAKEAADLLAYTEERVRHLCKTGRLDGYRVGEEWFVSLASLEDHRKFCADFGALSSVSRRALPSKEAQNMLEEVLASHPEQAVAAATVGSFLVNAPGSGAIFLVWNFIASPVIRSLVLILLLSGMVFVGGVHFARTPLAAKWLLQSRLAAQEVFESASILASVQARRGTALALSATEDFAAFRTRFSTVSSGLRFAFLQHAYLLREHVRRDFRISLLQIELLRRKGLIVLLHSQKVGYTAFNAASTEIAGVFASAKEILK